MITCPAGIICVAQATSVSQRAIFRRRAGTARWFLGICAAVFVVWAAGLLWFIADIPRKTPRALAATDAIVVLTGGRGRLPAGLDLLATGRGKKLFVSGVYRGVDVDALLRVSQQAPGNLECCIALGYRAGNTRGNADETAAWMRDEGYESLRLVTANYHMRRSLLEFHREMPGATVRPHPIQPEHVEIENWWRSPGTARLLVSEYAKYLVAVSVGSLLPAGRG